MWRRVTSFSLLLAILGCYEIGTFLLFQARQNPVVDAPQWSLDKEGHSFDVSKRPTPSLDIRGGWPILQEDKSQTVPQDPNNCCGPWKCSYYDSKEFEEEKNEAKPLVTVVMNQLASDWQKKAGFKFDGVPQLNFTKKNDFVVQCTTLKDFQIGGRYKFTGYILLQSFTLEMTRVDRGGKRSSSNKSHVVAEGRGLSRIWNEDIPVVEIGDSSRATEASPQRQTYQMKFTAHSIDQKISGRGPKRNFFLMTWIQVQSSWPSRKPSMEKEVACMVTSECHGGRTVCHDKATKGLSSGERNWGLCKDYVPTTPQSETQITHRNPSPCLVYSVGIRDIYKNEELMGREGCEVHAFDCTVDLPTNLAPNVTFHPWCIGSDSTELKLDGTSKTAQSSVGKKDHEFLTFSQIVQRLGHNYRELTVLKMDCEGCEYLGLQDLIQRLPSFASRIRMLMLELHLVTSSPTAKSKQRKKELETMQEISRFLANYRVYDYSINSDTSVDRFQEPSVYYKQLYPVGVHMGTCCYEFSMVRKDLAHSPVNSPSIVIV